MLSAEAEGRGHCREEARPWRRWPVPPRPEADDLDPLAGPCTLPGAP